MKLRSRWCLALILTWAMSGVAFSQESQPTLRIGFLNNNKYQYLDGCGCYLGTSLAANAHYIFLAELDGSRAWIKIDNAVVALKMTNTTYKSQRKKGERYTETYESKGVQVRVTYVITRPCPPEGEVTGFSATIQVTKGLRTRTVWAVGDCGC